MLTDICNHQLNFVYLLLLAGESSFEMKREADSNDITESSHDKPTVGMFVVFLKLYSLQSFLCVWFSFFAVHFVAKRYILQQKCLKEQIGTCLLGTCSPVQCTLTLRATMLSITDGQPDRWMEA